jgi:hypothetical protein
VADPEQQPDVSRRNVRLGAAVLLVLVIAVGLNLARNRGSGDSAPKFTEALRRSLEQNGCTVDTRADKGQKHVSQVTYSVNPPAGGDHDPAPSPAKVYDITDVPADARLVHSLEHGFVVVWYRPDGVTAATVDRLREMAGSHKWVLVVPRPSLPSALAATAWHRRLLCPDGADGPINTFVNAFRNAGPEKGFV